MTRVRADLRVVVAGSSQVDRALGWRSAMLPAWWRVRHDRGQVADARVGDALMPSPANRRLASENQPTRGKRMRPRQNHGSKKKLADLSDWTQEQLDSLAEKLTYSGNPLHKMNPGDYNLTPLCAGGRPGKSLCDSVKAFTKSEALQLLREGCRRGLIDHNIENGWPKRIWAVYQEVVLEAQHDKSPSGSYHGYPLQADDNFKNYIMDRWGSLL